MRILIASATFVALASPVAEAMAAPPIWWCFFLPHSYSQKQCAFNITHGSKNKAVIDQDQWGPGFQFGLNWQNGDGNDAYTGQTGTNEVALTFQNGNNNTAYTSQNGNNKLSVTVQHGNGLWAATSSGGNNTVTAVVQSN